MWKNLVWFFFKLSLVYFYYYYVNIYYVVIIEKNVKNVIKNLFNLYIFGF